MVEVSPIRGEVDYDAAIERVELLMEDPSSDAVRDELEVLSALIERYEERHYPIPPPDPVAAIEFRMDQMDLTRRDLIPYLGSRARVSEVLSGKRPLTMSMARALHRHLGIPAESLIHSDSAPMDLSPRTLEVERFPLEEMASFGWIPPVSPPDTDPRALVDGLYARAFGAARSADFSRRPAMGLWSEHADPAAIQAWCLGAAAAANASPLGGAFVPGIVTPDFLHKVAQLSATDWGPIHAQSYLAQHGIALQIVPPLTGTHLDGATLWGMGPHPVIALTLRNDRLARFWQGLLHELAHLGRHAELSAAAFLDDLDLPRTDPIEQEADEWAREAMIPSMAWDAWATREDYQEQDVVAFARDLGIHPIIVAERLRDELNNQHRFPRLVGKGMVGPQFGL